VYTAPNKIAAARAEASMSSTWVCGAKYVRGTVVALGPDTETCIDERACDLGGRTSCRSNGDVFAECVDNTHPATGHTSACSDAGWWGDNGMCRDKYGCSAVWENGDVVCATLDAAATYNDQSALDPS
jgi:hypothetical protein